MAEFPLDFIKLACSNGDNFDTNLSQRVFDELYSDISKSQTSGSGNIKVIGHPPSPAVYELADQTRYGQIGAIFDAKMHAWYLSYSVSCPEADERTVGFDGSGKKL